jgi:antitoxin component YwqK of YwqJK toxin-antitoxin module
MTAQEHTDRHMRYGKVLFDKKEVVKGEKDGLFRDYFRDGKTVRCEGVIVDGEMNGEWMYYLADGTLDVIYKMKDGKLKKMDRESWK